MAEGIGLLLATVLDRLARAHDAEKDDDRRHGAVVQVCEEIYEGVDVMTVSECLRLCGGLEGLEVKWRGFPFTVFPSRELYVEMGKLRRDYLRMTGSAGSVADARLSDLPTEYQRTLEDAQQKLKGDLRGLLRRHCDWLA